MNMKQVSLNEQEAALLVEELQPKLDVINAEIQALEEKGRHLKSLIKVLNGTLIHIQQVKPITTPEIKDVRGKKVNERRKGLNILVQEIVAKADIPLTSPQVAKKVADKYPVRGANQRNSLLASVSSVLSAMFRSGHLDRVKEGDSYIYTTK